MYQEILIILLISLQISCIRDEVPNRSSWPARVLLGLFTSFLILIIISSEESYALEVTTRTRDDGNKTTSTKDASQITATTRDWENISTKDDSQESFYQDLELYDTQAGGHSDMWKDKKGFIWKAEGKQKESPFYDSLEKTEDLLLQELRSFTPKYGGAVVQKLEKDTKVWVRIEDITKDMKEPCVMDLKIGKHTFAPNISKRKLFKQLLKYREMRERWGFSITGFRYYDADTGILVKRGPSFGRSMDPEDAIRVIWEFMNGDRGLKHSLVRVILEQLRKLDSWFERQRFYKFYGSSILITYDATYLAENVKPPAGPIVSVRMIDFTQTIPNTDGFEDDNYMYGLEKLIALFEELDSEGFKYSGVSDKFSETNFNDSSIDPKEKYKLFEPTEYSIETTKKSRQIDKKIPKEEQEGGKEIENSSNIVKGFLNLKVGDGLVTPIYEPKEIAFYNSLEETKDTDLQKLKKFTLAEKGILNMENKENFLQLQAISSSFHLPCVMQVKIGKKIWDGHDLVEPPKISYETMRNRLGFNIEGFYFFNMTKKVLEQCKTIECRNMNPKQGIQAIHDFVNGKLGLQSGFVDTVLDQLKEIAFWFKQHRTLHFYNSSILIAYDASNLERGTFPLVNPAPEVRVQMVDFAHVLKNSDGTKDENYIQGLKELIYIIRNLDIKKAEIESNAHLLKTKKITQI